MVAKPVIISRAITGSLHTPSMSPDPLVTPIAASIEAAGACAAIAHLHARDPQHGRPRPIRTCSCSS